MSYRIELARSAARELDRVPKPYHAAIVRALEGLSIEPRPPGCKKLAGGTGLWRIRVGPYRVVHSIHDVIRLVKVERVRNREEAY